MPSAKVCRVRESHPVIPGADAWSHHAPGSDVGVVVTHGFTGSPISTRPLGERLAEEGWNVVVPRLPGHGTSWRDLARTRYADYRVALDQVVDELAGRADHVVLVGLSLGGTLVLDVTAGLHRAGLAGVIAGVVTINGQVLDRDEFVAKLGPVLQHVVPVVPREAAGLPTNDISKPGVVEGSYAFVPAKAGQSVARAFRGVRHRLSEVDVPLLVAHSPQDHSVAPENAAAILELVGTEETTELVLERSFHVATLDHDAELLADEVAAFVRDVTDARR